jgi:hypothetical protein
VAAITNIENMRLKTMLKPKLRIIFPLLLLLFPLSIQAQQGEGDSARFPAGGWSTFVRGGVVQQFDTDLSEEGSFDATRLALQAGMSYAWDYRTSVSISLGYSYDGYSFSVPGQGQGFSPWEDINTLSLSAPMRWGIGESWSAFLVPTIRATGEQGSDVSDSVTGGGFTGFAYRFSDRLTIGPGIGVISQIEDSATVFPILIIDWKITDRLSFETGSGLGATLGPGLVLNYQLDPSWKLSLGGRYEKLRFRLDEDGPVQNGIGEDKSFPLFIGCTYNFSRQNSLSLIGGIETGGDLRVEDEEGNLIKKESYDTGGFLGLTFNLRI